MSARRAAVAKCINSSEVVLRAQNVVVAILFVK